MVVKLVTQLIRPLTSPIIVPCLLTTILPTVSVITLCRWRTVKQAVLLTTGDAEMTNTPLVTGVNNALGTTVWSQRVIVSP